MPAFATLVAEPLLVLVDTTIVGHLGTPQLAGLTLAANVLGVLVGISIFLAYGTTATVSRRLGAGDRRGAIAGGIDGMVLGALLGAALAAAVLAAAPQLLGLYGSTPEATAHGVTYLRIVVLGMPAQLVMLAATGVLRGLQDTRTPLRVVLAINLLNIVLNLVLVYGFGWGIAGAAAGTAVSQWLGASIMAAVVLAGGRRLGVTAGFHPAGVLDAARTGGWLVLRSLVLQGSITVTTFAAAAAGEVALAGHQVANTLWYTMVWGLDAFAIAAQAMVGLRLGASDVAGTRAVLRRVLRWGVGSGLVVAVALVATRPLLARVFTPDAAVHAALMPTLVVLAVIIPVGAVVFMLDGVLIGAGDARYLALANTVATAVHVPFALAVMAAGLGLPWLWGAYGVWIAARGATLVVRARGDAWLRTGG